MDGGLYDQYAETTGEAMLPFQCGDVNIGQQQTHTYRLVTVADSPPSAAAETSASAVRTQ